MIHCNQQTSNRRRLFWATQIDVCGSSDVCGFECGDPGLAVEYDRVDGTASISNEDWMQGIILNMLMTDGRLSDTDCGHYPGSQGGHWSTSYIESGPSDIGTLIRSVAPSGRVNEIASLITAHAQSTLQRLVDRGVALKIDVSGSYVGNSKFALNVVVYGTNNEITRVGITGARLTEGWVWN